MKLRAVIVDDEPKIFTDIKEFCKDSPVLEIIGTFTDPVEFLKIAPTIDFDIAFLDIQMDKMLGTQVASQLNNKAVIYVTGAFNYLKDAIRTAYADVVLKPIEKHLLEAAIEKAHAIILKRQGFKVDSMFFDLAYEKKRVNLKLKDIFLVTTDTIEPRHKHITMRDGNRYEINDYKLEDILELSDDLFQANKSELVAFEAVDEIRDNASILVLKGIYENGKPKMVSLTRVFRKGFVSRILSR